jgi:hypothetical protein
MSSSDENNSLASSTSRPLNQRRATEAQPYCGFGGTDKPWDFPFTFCSAATFSKDSCEKTTYSGPNGVKEHCVWLEPAKNSQQQVNYFPFCGHPTDIRPWEYPVTYCNNTKVAILSPQNQVACEATEVKAALVQHPCTWSAESNACIAATKEDNMLCNVFIGEANCTAGSYFLVHNKCVWHIPPAVATALIGYTVAPTPSTPLSPTLSLVPSLSASPTTSVLPSMSSAPTKYAVAIPSFPPSTRSPVLVSTVAQPTRRPTIQPYPLPTRPPTQRPSPIPTTYGPTNRPTPSPVYLTKAPSHSPTKSPIFEPHPSMMPSVNPSLMPTGSPSIQPSIPPSLSKSSSYPSANPTVMLSASPTRTPSVSPTRLPSVSPTTIPSVTPTSDPTWAPTRHRTHFPTPEAESDGGSMNIPATTALAAGMLGAAAACVGCCSWCCCWRRKKEQVVFEGTNANDAASEAGVVVTKSKKEQRNDTISMFDVEIGGVGAEADPESRH